MFGGCCHDRQNEFNQNFVGENDINMDIDVNMAGGNINMANAMPAVDNQNLMMGSTMQSPIVEPMQERVVHRTIMHEVPHVCPQRTKIINHHVYKHTYRPSYSCCEENTVSNIQCGSCCQFR